MTIMELVVSIAIFMMLTLVVVVNTRSDSTGAILDEAAAMLASDLRKIQNNAMTGLTQDKLFPAGYGFFFDTATPTQYLLFADMDGDWKFGPGDVKINGKETELLPRIQIGGFRILPPPERPFQIPDTEIHIAFPILKDTIFIGTDAIALSLGRKVCIFLENSKKTRFVNVESFSGQITIDDQCE